MTPRLLCQWAAPVADMRPLAFRLMVAVAVAFALARPLYALWRRLSPPLYVVPLVLIGPPFAQGVPFYTQLGFECSSCH